MHWRAVGWNILIPWLALVTGLTNEDDSPESSRSALSIQRWVNACLLQWAPSKRAHLKCTPISWNWLNIPCIQIELLWEIRNYIDLQNAILLLFLHLWDEISFQGLDTRRALIFLFGSLTYVKTLGLKETHQVCLSWKNIVKNLSVIFTGFSTTYMEIIFPHK